MKILRFSALFLIAVCIITLTAAASGEENPDTGILIGMPNPSAVWAEQMGYQYEIRTNPDGSEYGVCILPDGSEYDSWRLFREYSGVATIQPSVSTGSTFSKEPGVRSLISARLSGLFR